jgi:hypothetical protein
MRIPERLRLGHNLTLRASPIVILPLGYLAWQVLVSAAAAAASLGQTDGNQKRKRESTVKQTRSRGWVYRFYRH